MLLTLSSENVCNTTFTSEAGHPLYVSSTPFRFGKWTTTINKYVSDDFQLEWDERFEVLCQIRWWDMHEHVVVLSVDDTTRKEVARYRRTAFGAFDILGLKSTKACLEIAPEIEHILDLVVITFIYVEKLRMDKEWWIKRFCRNP
ncbi:hypothetical protein ID866_10684 [Astraeus odoratus]|nr:hypothetical protein ID866_10684 [Astraeus odoratus]